MIKVIKGWSWRYPEARCSICLVFCVGNHCCQLECKAGAQAGQENAVNINAKAAPPPPNCREKHNLQRPLHLVRLRKIEFVQFAIWSFFLDTGCTTNEEMLQIAMQREFLRFFDYVFAKLFNLLLSGLGLYVCYKEGTNCCKCLQKIVPMSTRLQLPKDFVNWQCKGSKYALMSVAGLLASRKGYK